MGSIILEAIWTLTLIALTFVCLRIYTRVKLVHRIWWDDRLAVFATMNLQQVPFDGKLELLNRPISKRHVLHQYLSSDFFTFARKVRVMFSKSAAT